MHASSNHAAPWTSLFATVPDPKPPRLVRLSNRVLETGVLRAYRCEGDGEDDSSEESSWPTATIASPQGILRYRVGFHPVTKEPGTGVVRKVLAPNLLSVTFYTNELFLHVDECATDDRAEATLAAPAVRLRRGVTPAFGFGALDPEMDAVEGVLRYDNRQRASPVLDDGTVVVMLPSEGQYLRMLMEELEPRPARASAPAPDSASPEFEAGDAVVIRRDVKHVYGDISGIANLDRTAVVVGTRRGGALVVNFPEGSLRVGIGTLSLERAWRPPVGARVRVRVDRPSAQPTRQNCLWAHAADDVGVVVATAHDGVAFVRFDEATPSVIQAYFFHELGLADSAPDEKRREAMEAAARCGTVCPLTMSPFVDPVCAADGNSYEASAWRRLCETSSGAVFVSSPLTREMISSHAYPNRSLRNLLEAQAHEEGTPAASRE